MELADKVLEIPYMFLYDRFRKMADMQHVKPMVQGEADMVFDLADEIPGMGEPDMSESDPSEWSGEEVDDDTTFRSRAGETEVGAERVTRLRVGLAARK